MAPTWHDGTFVYVRMAQTTEYEYIYCFMIERECKKMATMQKRHIHVDRIHLLLLLLSLFCAGSAISIRDSQNHGNKNREKKSGRTERNELQMKGLLKWHRSEQRGVYAGNNGIVCAMKQ